MMTRQGCRLEPARDAGFILDRLEGLSKVIPAGVLEQALSDTGRDKQRACRLSHEVMLWVVLVMGVLMHLPIREVFKHVRRLRAGERTPSRSNLCGARARFGAEPVRRIFDVVVRPLAEAGMPGTFFQGQRLMGIDGTVLDVPDTPANAERFSCSSGSRGDSAFPQVRKVSLVELGTHAQVAVAIGGRHDSEQKLVGQLWDEIPADPLLIEDRGFFSYQHWNNPGCWRRQAVDPRERQHDSAADPTPAGRIVFGQDLSVVLPSRRWPRNASSHAVTASTRAWSNAGCRGSKRNVTSIAADHP